MRIVRGWCAPRWATFVCICACCVLAAGARVSYASTDSVPAVELQCKITAAKESGPVRSWVFELRKASGELVHLQTAFDGQSIKVKRLSPAIYIVCLSGDAGRESCESMDLNVPQPGKSVRIRKELTPPIAAALSADHHVVGMARLAVPQEAHTAMLAAQRAEMDGDEDGAREELERALQIYPDYPQALNNLGTAYYRSGKYSESLELLSRATALDPDLYAAWVNLAGSLMALARFDAAVDAVHKALELRPNDALANSRAGLAYYYKREYELATRYFKKSLDLDPAAASSPQLFLAHIALGQGRLREAEKYLQEYLDVHPHAPDAARLKVTLQRMQAGAFAGIASTPPDQWGK